MILIFSKSMYFRAKTEYNTHTGICALVIPQMFADDIGEYTCRASNSHGIAETSAQVADSRFIKVSHMCFFF